jgi:hypothetical protein
MCLQVEVVGFDEVFERVGDELVGPEAGCAGAEGCADGIRGDAVFVELGLVADDGDVVGELGGNGS